jgi:uncharacterized protein (TIGR00290 family)
MLAEDGERSRSHGLPAALLQKQAAALGVPLVTRSASWESYEREFTAAIRDFQANGTDIGVFGDIDIEAHREWVEKICSFEGIIPYLPLWRRERRSLLDELFRTGFKAVIIAVREGALDKRFLGKTLNIDVILEIERAGLDSLGEAGEYHTVITDCPIFSRPLTLKKGNAVLKEGYWFLDVQAI